MAATSGTVYAAVNATLFTCALVVLLLSTIALTYTLCVGEGSCPKFLPTISDTWTTPPGNYISRVVVSVGALGLQFANLAMYHVSSGIRDYSKTYPSEGFCLGMSVFATFLLSWVGAICDNNLPECMGNNEIHITCAVGFFLLYAIYLIFMFNVPTKAGKRVVGRNSANVFLSLSLAAKLRFIPAIADSMRHVGHADFPALAIVEWADVAINMLCVAKYFVQNANGYQLAITSKPITPTSTKLSSMLPATGRQALILTQISSDAIATLTSVVAVTTIGFSWYLAFHEDVIPHNQTLPDINKLFTHQPNNWFGRWGVILISSCLSGLMLINHYILSTSAGTKAYTGSWVRVAQLLFAIAGVCSLSVLGAVNVTENKTLHGQAAVVFFFAYLVYMALATLDEVVRNGCSLFHRGPLLLVITAVAAVTKLRFSCVRACISACIAHAAMSERMLGGNASVYNGNVTAPRGNVTAPGLPEISDIPFEWADVACIALFLAVQVFFRPQAAGRRFGIAVVKSD